MTEEPELPLDKPNPNIEESYAMHMYSNLMAESRDFNDVADRTWDWLVKLNYWYGIVGVSLLFLAAWYTYKAHSAETRARIYRLEHAAGL